MCPTPDSTLADPQEINADLQRQLAECRAARDEALARETAMADVLRVINSSPGDLASGSTRCSTGHYGYARRASAMLSPTTGSASTPLPIVASHLLMANFFGQDHISRVRTG